MLVCVYERLGENACVNVSEFLTSSPQIAQILRNDVTHASPIRQSHLPQFSVRTLVFNLKYSIFYSNFIAYVSIRELSINMINYLPPGIFNALSRVTIL